MFPPGSLFFFFLKKICYQVVTNRITCYFVSLAQNSTHVNYITRPKIKIGIYLFSESTKVWSYSLNTMGHQTSPSQNKKLKVSSHISIIFTLISIVHGQLWHNLYYLLFCQNFQKQIIFYVKIFEIQSKHKQGNHIWTHALFNKITWTALNLKEKTTRNLS
jgi:hypothetical protein